MIVFLAMKWSGNFEAGQEKDLKQKTLNLTGAKYTSVIMII